ncbi:prepilin-type N-terminal cleavage/methylation domain-containing protein [Pontiella sp.]|uniref:type IV pilus modification PilV family protein n=1 Tax=Pontiella sp. TaxID=2837462 RepID=UPI0035694BC1
MKKNGRKKSGATLIEVMLALILLAIMATAVPLALQYPRQLIVNSLQRQVSVLAATEALELARAWNPDDLSGGWITAAQNLGRRYGLNGRTVTITPTVTPNDDMAIIAVSVDYPGSGGDPVYLETRIYAP